MSVSPDLLEILRCPKCRREGREGTLVQAPAGDSLECPACRLRYAVTEGIPDMIIEEAAPF
ncbi:MAG: hypothetical protein RL698_2822 [Pseudomonadota bacterium]|jgi:uncharacterized protein YbaR (Trm112 family)